MARAPPIKYGRRRAPSSRQPSTSSTESGNNSAQGTATSFMSTATTMEKPEISKSREKPRFTKYDLPDLIGDSVEPKRVTIAPKLPLAFEPGSSSTGNIKGRTRFRTMQTSNRESSEQSEQSKLKRTPVKWTSYEQPRRYRELPTPPSSASSTFSDNTTSGGVKLSQEALDSWTMGYRAKTSDKPKVPQLGAFPTDQTPTKHQRPSNPRLKRSRKISQPCEPKGFLKLPRELRDMIYEYAVDLSGITENVKNEEREYFKSLAKRHRGRPKPTQRKIKLLNRLKKEYGAPQTPTILLLNWQIHHEAMRILCKCSILFTAPAIVSPTLFPLRDLISPGILRKVKDVRFEIPMKQHIPAAMEAMMRIGKNWWNFEREDNETLEKSDFWAYFIMDCLSLLWPVERHGSTVTIVIIQADGSADEYPIKQTNNGLDQLKDAIAGCLKTRRLEHFIGHLNYARIHD